MMKDLRKKFFANCLILCCLFLIGTGRMKVEAEETILPKVYSNVTVRLITTSFLTVTDDGYMRVFYDGTQVNVEYYDDDFNIQSRKTLDMELDLWGGFYAGTDGYYLVEGQNNEEESDTAEVIRVIRYDKQWNKTGTAKITRNTSSSSEVRYPFDHGCVEMTESDGNLYIVTGHQGYVDPMYGQGHQGFLMIKVNETSMTGEIVASDLSHSFAQYIETKDSDMYVLEQSEGSRCTQLSRYDVSTLSKDSLSVLDYGGYRTSAYAVDCYASVDGMALSTDNVLCLGTSIDQTQYDSYSSSMSYNIYLTVTPTSDFSESATTVNWITNYSGDGKRFAGAKLTKINDDRFMISWRELKETQTADNTDALSPYVLHYIFVDGNGNKLTEEFKVGASLSDCQPVVKGNQIVYCGSGTGMVDFYSIDAETGEFSKKTYRVIGDHVTWDLKDGVLTVSGSGEMTTGSTAVNSVWSFIQDEIKKIVIKSGITSIPEDAFAYLNSVTEVEIESGLQTIGAYAFYSCDSLRKVTIPSSVTSIGTGIVWTRYLWISDNSHVVYAKIYAPEGSYAIQYAKENNISYNGSYNSGAGGNSGTGGISGEDEDEKSVNGYSGTTIKTVKIVPGKVNISKVTSSKSKTIRVTWKKNSQVDGYQIQYAKNAKFTKGQKTVTVKGKSKVSKTISKLKKKTTYYVRIRGYKKVNGITYYGAWSKKVKIKCK
jgi:hypothetical protein